MGKKKEDMRTREQLMEEYVKLKQIISGYVTSNGNYRRQVKELEKRVLHYRELDLEGDVLYEESLAVSDELAKRLIGAEGENYALRKRNAMLSSEAHSLTEKVRSLSEENDELNIQLEMNRTPWWKRTF